MVTDNGSVLAAVIQEVSTNIGAVIVNNDAAGVGEEVVAKKEGFWSNLWGKKSSQKGYSVEENEEGMEEVVVQGSKGSGIVGLGSDFITDLSAVFDSQAEGGFLSKMGTLFTGLGSNLSSIFGDLLGSLGGVFSKLLGGLGGGGAGGIGGFFASLLGGGAAKGAMAPGGFEAFAKGGVVSRPTVGLIGEGRMNEAVVPLPDGKSIPISGNMGGSTQNNNNNITVNVDAQGGTSVTGDSGQDNMNQLGKMLGVAVRETLANEMRPGGLLSR